MNVRLLLITAAVAAATGALLGWTGLGALRAAKSEDAHAPILTTEVTTPTAGAHSFIGENPRQVKLFSALKEPVALRKRFLLFEAIQELQPDDFKSVADHVEKLPYEISYELLGMLLPRWIQVDPKAVQEWSLVHRGRSGGLSLWAKANPQAALEALKTLTDPAKADSLIRDAIEALPGEPEAKIEQVRQFPPSPARDAAIMRLLLEWGMKNPGAAFAALDDLLPITQRADTRSSLLQHWAARDPGAALEKLESLLPSLKLGALGNDLVTAVVDKVPEAQLPLVVDWLSKLPPELRSAAGIAAARKWAKKDPVAALEWCLENGVEPARGHRFGFSSWGAGVLGEAIENKPNETVAWLEQLPEGTERDRLSERALADSFWLLKKGEAFSQAETALLRIFAQLPEDAQIRQADAFGKRRAREGGLTDLNAWAQHFPAGAPRANAIAGAMAGAYERDASRLDGFLEQLGTSADRDAALRGLAIAMQEEATADAATRAAMISDAATRRETLEEVIVPWLKRDATASREWLRNGGHEIPQSWTDAWLQAR